MDPVSIAVLATTAAKAGLSFFGSQDKARQMRRETDEAVRRLKLGQSQVLGTAEARVGASGFEASSTSLTTYLTQMSSEFAREADWMRKAGYRNASAVSKAGKFGLASDLGAGLFQFGASNNWFKSPAETGPELLNID